MSTRRENKPSDEIVDKVQKAFIMFEAKDFLTSLRTFASGDTCWFDCVDVSMQGLHSVISAAGLPFNLKRDEVIQRKFERIYVSERRKYVRNPYRTYTEPEISEDEADRRAREQAEIEMGLFLASQDGKDYIRDAVIHGMNFRLDSRNIRIAAEELLVQTLISAWSVFESFSRAFMIAWVNEDPERAQPILASADLKDLFGKQVVGIQVISDHGYDLSQSMGTVLFSNRRLDSLNSIRGILKAIFNSSKLQIALGEALWLVNQRRHLFVHRRGIVDSEYLRNTKDNAPIGSKLNLTAGDIEHSLAAVRDAILAVCDAAAESK